MLVVRSNMSTPAELPKFTLTDLPNELLTIILQSLRSNDLLLIACSCTRLNDIALRLFFRSVEFHPESPESSLNIGVHPKQPFTILKGIRLCITLRALHTLRCHFSDQSLIDEMEEILELLILLPAVSSIHLTFPSPAQSDYNYYSMSRFLESFTLWESETDPRWLAFAKALLALLNALHQKGCTRLEITGLTPPSSLKSGGRRVPLRSTNTLREVIISTGHTLSGRLLDWVVQSVNSSPVQTLNLTTYHHWDLTPLTILSRVNLPYLTDFHMCISAQIIDIVSCLRRNPNLRSLRVVLWWHHAGVKPELNLPHLTHLAGVPKFVIDFLSLPLTFPALHTVHLLTAGLSSNPEEPCYLFRGVELSQTFSALRSCPTIHSLSLTMDHGVMANWMEDFGSSVNTQVQKTESLFELHHIVHLTVYEGAAVQHVFPQWLSIIFPNLKTLIFDDRHANRAPFLRQLYEVCPMTLEVSFSKNATPKSVARWLDPDDVQA